MSVAEGLMTADELVRFIGGGASDPLAGMAIGAVIVASFLCGLAMNLTPCVLPMVPVNLIVIGRNVRNALAYALGIALAYGTLGVMAAVGGMAFGTIQSNPWFNLAVALVFAVLSLSLVGLFHVDFSRYRTKVKNSFVQPSTSSIQPVFAFSMGVMSALLAGACVAPILIAVLALTAKLFSEGKVFALGLPFVLGLGMAFPWPFLAAGLQLLPKPGEWMKWVNRVFALLVAGLAVWYGALAWNGFSGVEKISSGGNEIETTPQKFAEVLAGVKRPVLVDCWATWCKNCAAMDRVIRGEKVQEKLHDWTIIRLQAEDIRELRKLPGFEQVRGLPAIGVIRD